MKIEREIRVHAAKERRRQKNKILFLKYSKKKTIKKNAALFHRTSYARFFLIRGQDAPAIRRTSHESRSYLGKQRDRETGRQGDRETGRQGDRKEDNPSKTPYVKYANSFNKYVTHRDEYGRTFTGSVLKDNIVIHCMTTYIKII
jgi:hypothetical protein